MFTFNKNLINMGVIIFLLFSGMAYADESQLIDLFGENFDQKTKQAQAVNSKSLNKKTKKNTIKTAPKTIEKAKNLSKISQKTVSKNKLKRKKTYYGIGYEYRKNLQRQRAYPERIQQPKHVDRITRPERVIRVERPTRIERPERIDRPERHGR